MSIRTNCAQRLRFEGELDDRIVPAAVLVREINSTLTKVPRRQHRERVWMSWWFDSPAAVDNEHAFPLKLGYRVT